MKIIDESTKPEEGSENSGIGAEPVESKSFGKQHKSAANTDQNPDKV